jgi:hypothetical protein
MKFTSYGSCDARLSRLVTLGHLVLLFLLQGSPATGIELEEIPEAGAGVSPRLARSSTMPQPQVNLPNKEGLRRISSLPPRTSKKDLLSDQPPRSNSDINPNELRPPTTPSPANEGPSHVPSNEGPSHVPSSEGSSHVPSNEVPSYVPSSESEKGKESSFWSRLSSIWAWLKKVLGFGHKSMFLDQTEGLWV